MLSKTFLSAADLKISEKLYDALVKVYWMLTDDIIPDEMFNMMSIGAPRLDAKGHACGTPGCILGWAHAVEPALLSGRRGSYDSGNVARLFYPTACGPAGDAIQADRAHAVRALHNYLTTGKANWREVMQA